MNRCTRMSALLLWCALALGGCAGLTDSPAEPPPLLEDRVKAALIESLGTAAAAIDPEAKEGAVRLRGFVDTEAERDQAAETARGVAGVSEVTNDIVVK